MRVQRAGSIDDRSINIGEVVPPKMYLADS